MKRLTAIILTAACLMMCVCITPAAAAVSGQTVDEASGNLVVGGSFENGIPAFDGTDGWYSRPNALGFRHSTDVTYGESSGSLYVQYRKASTGSSSWPDQTAFAYTFKARYNSWYKLSYKVRPEGKITFMNYYFEGKGDLEKPSASQLISATPQLTVTTDNNTQWVSYEGYFQVKNPQWKEIDTEDSRYTDVTVYPATFYGGVTDFNYYIDDMRIEKLDGTFNSDFSLVGSDNNKPLGWGNTGTVSEASDFPEGKCNAVTISSLESLTQRVSIESDKLYYVEAWVKNPMDKPAAITLRANDYNVRNYVRYDSTNNSVCTDGNMAAWGNSGTYIPNDGKWHKITSLLAPSKSNRTDRTAPYVGCHDADISIKWTTDETKSAMSGAVSSGDSLLIAKYEIKPVNSKCDEIDGSGRVRSTSGIYYSFNLSGNRPAVGGVSNGWPSGTGVLKFSADNNTATGINWGGLRVDLSKTPGLSYKMTAADGTCFVDRSADIKDTDIEAYVKLSDSDTLSGDEKIQFASQAYGKPETKTLYGESVALTHDWQKITALNVTNAHDRFGFNVTGTINGKTLLFRDLRIVKRPEVKKAVVSRLELSQANGIITPSITVDGDSVYALRYRWYEKELTASDYSLLKSGETTYGGTVPAVNYESGKQYKLTVAPISSTFNIGDVSSAEYKERIFEIGEALVYNTADLSPVESICGVKSVGAKVTVYNTTDEEKTFSFILAAYKGDELEDVRITEKTMNQTGELETDTPIAVTENTTAVKAFLWENTNDLRPYGKTLASITKESAALSNYKSLIDGKKQITVAFLGGSITAGVGAKSGEEYAALVGNWMGLFAEEQGSAAGVTVKNYGVGGTGSDYGALRIGDRLIADEPDVLFVEFAVNDENKTEKTLTPYMESIVRQAKNNNPDIDIVFINTFMGNFLPIYNTGDLPVSIKRNNEIAAHYGIPSINVGKYLYEKITEENDGIIESQPVKGDGSTASNVYYGYMNDNAHPTAKGYSLYASKITSYLEELYNGAGKAKSAMPSAISDYFIGTNNSLTDNQSVTMTGGEKIDAYNTHGYDIYKFSEKDSGVTVSFNGTALYLWIPRHNTTGVMTVSVDGKEAYDINTWDNGSFTVQQTWLTDYACKLIPIAAGLESGNHTVTIKNKGEKPSNSKGSDIYLANYAVKTN